jgi:hypothetical protein
MTKREIVDTALRGAGKARVCGDSMEPIMPYLLSDIMSQIYYKDIAGLRHKHRMKEMDKNWRKRYAIFIRPVFSLFKEEDKCELTDLMDSVYDNLSNEITMLRAKIMEALSGIDDFERKKVVSSLLLCHIFAQYAECSYNRCYYTVKSTSFGIIEEPASNKDLCYLRDHSYNMAMQYIKETPGDELVIRHPNMDGLFAVVAKKIYQWLKDN